MVFDNNLYYETLAVTGNSDLPFIGRNPSDIIATIVFEDPGVHALGVEEK